jgi:hypothetical protein
MRAYRVDITPWMALASLLLFILAALAYSWASVRFVMLDKYFMLNAAIALTVSSSLFAFISLGAATVGRQGATVLMGFLMGLLYCFLALPLIAVVVFMLFLMVWSGNHMNAPT